MSVRRAARTLPCRSAATSMISAPMSAMMRLPAAAPAPMAAARTVSMNSTRDGANTVATTWRSASCSVMVASTGRQTTTTEPAGIGSRYWRISPAQHIDAAGSVGDPSPAYRCVGGADGVAARAAQAAAAGHPHMGLAAAEADGYRGG